MKDTCVCDQKVTPQMIRQGLVVRRGHDLICRQCPEAKKIVPRSARQAVSPSRPSRPFPRTAAARPSRAGAERSAPAAVEYASFWRRFGAHVIDSVILNVAVLIGSAGIGLGAGLFGFVDPTVASVLGGLVGGVVPLAYCLWFWMRRGATPGKVVLGIRIVAGNGGPPTGVQSFVRYLAYIPSTIVFGLGYFWMLWDDEKRCWHDILAGTRVIRT